MPNSMEDEVSSNSKSFTEETSVVPVASDAAELQSSDDTDMFENSFIVEIITNDTLNICPKTANDAIAANNDNKPCFMKTMDICDNSNGFEEPETFKEPCKGIVSSTSDKADIKGERAIESNGGSEKLPPIEDRDLDAVIKSKRKRLTCNTVFPSKETVNELLSHSNQESSLKKKYVKSPLKLDCVEKSHAVNETLSNHSSLHKADASYACNICSTKFSNKSDMRRHALIHSGENRFPCATCNISYTRKSNLTKHLTRHRILRPKVCNICRKSFSSMGDLNIHLLWHKGEKLHVCQICSQPFFLITELNIHLLRYHGEKSHVCQICNKSFVRADLLKKHKRISCVKQSYNCKICKRSFSKNSAFRVHMTKHKSHVCRICSKSFFLKSNLDKHMLIHGGDKPFVCGVCNKCFTLKRNLKVHMSLHCGGNSHERKVPNICKSSTIQSQEKHNVCHVEEPETFKEPCKGIVSRTSDKADIIGERAIKSNGGSEKLPPIEDRDLDAVIKSKRKRLTRNTVFPSKETVNAHLLSHSDQESSLKKKYVKSQLKLDCVDKSHAVNETLSNHSSLHKADASYACNICSKKFRKKSNMKRHALIHSGENCFRCGTCNKSYTRTNNLTNHLKKHRILRQKVCNICRKSFSSMGDLNIHLLWHKGEKLHVCQICSQPFFLISELDIHLLRYHGENSHVCQICNKSFVRADLLKKHKRFSCGKQSYNCKICKRSFSENSAFRVHMTKHKSHVCRICSKSFFLKRNLDKHMLIHGGDKPFVCGVCNKCFTLKRNLKVHMFLHCGGNSHERKVPNTCKSSTIQSPEKHYVCHVCDKSFTAEKSFKRHSFIHKKNHNCRVCKLSFSSSTELSTHSAVHRVCNICNKLCKSRKSLKIHLVTHGDIKPFSCDICDRSFTQIKSYNYHKLMHTGVKMFVCNLCGKAFLLEKQLKKHSLTHANEQSSKSNSNAQSTLKDIVMETDECFHKGDQSESCRKCNTSFSQKQQPNSRILQRKGKIPFPCQICDKVFLQERLLKMHSLIHIGEKVSSSEASSEKDSNKSVSIRGKLKVTSLFRCRRKPHVCEICTETFTLKSLLMKHTLIHTEGNLNMNMSKTSSVDKDKLRAVRTNKNKKNALKYNVYDKLSTVESFLSNSSLNQSKKVPKSGKALSNSEKAMKKFPPNLNRETLYNKGSDLLLLKGLCANRSFISSSKTPGEQTVSEKLLIVEKLLASIS